MAPLTINCLLFSGNPNPERHVFEVKIDQDTRVMDLKDLIKAEAPVGLAHTDANNLELWQVSIPVNRQLGAALEDNPFEGRPGKLKPIMWVLRLFDTDPFDPECLHILIRAPDAPIAATRPSSGKSQREPSDLSSILLERWSKPIRPLPPLENLAAYLQGVLEEDSKPPISDREMRSLRSKTDAKSMCTLADYQRLFRTSEDEEAIYIWNPVQWALTHTPPDNDSIEKGFISFWDSNIRNMLEATITGKIIRDSDEHTSPALLRPDFGLLVDGVCVFRGEEKPPQYNGRHPKAELLEKLTWTYYPAPYILGYYAIGTAVTLVAISRSSVTDLVSVDLSWRSHRLRFMANIIKLCSVITALRDVIGSRNASELVPITREDTGTIVKVGSSAVEKRYTRADGPNRVCHLLRIYDLLKEKAVPNVDRLLQHYVDDEEHGSVVYLQPKGVNAFPRCPQEVREAVVCILKALVVLHADPKPLFHRDIRWPNIIRDASDQEKWFLVDWDDASASPTMAATHLNKKSHSPAVFKDNHGAEVDIWASGKLIVDAVAFTSDISPAMRAIGDSMIAGEITTAAEALALVELV